MGEMTEGVRGNTVATILPWYSCTKMVYVKPNPKTGVPSGHWPIPESFFPDGNTSKLVGYNMNFITINLFDSCFVALQIGSSCCVVFL
jgi:hypothetical protein